MSERLAPTYPTVWKRFRGGIPCPDTLVPQLEHFQTGQTSPSKLDGTCGLHLRPRTRVQVRRSSLRMKSKYGKRGVRTEGGGQRTRCCLASLP